MSPLGAVSIGGSLVAASRTIRAHICELYHSADLQQIVLCPGQLVALIHIFHAMRLRSILMSNEEYYTSGHFPGMEVSKCESDEIAKIAHRDTPDVVLMSRVSWKGQPLPVRREFLQIRTRPNRPLLICDYAHAGAVGFPTFRAQAADIICGDLHKWVFPEDHMAQLAFVWSSTRNLQKEINSIFSGYYLAGNKHLARAARWISPYDLLSAAKWLRSSDSTRSSLRKSYRRNLAVAMEIVESLRLVQPARSCILWLSPDESIPRKHEIDCLQSRGDVQIWKTGEGCRIMCSGMIKRALTYRGPNLRTAGRIRRS